jgi:hypothetical protein
MRAYKVAAYENQGDKDKQENPLATRYGSTNADSKTKRDELMEQFSVKKGLVSIEEVEIPVAKAELLEFINTLSAAADVELAEA